MGVYWKREEEIQREGEIRERGVSGTEGRKR